MIIYIHIDTVIYTVHLALPFFITRIEYRFIFIIIEFVNKKTFEISLLFQIHILFSIRSTCDQRQCVRLVGRLLFGFLNVFEINVRGLLSLG